MATTINNTTTDITTTPDTSGSLSIQQAGVDAIVINSTRQVGINMTPLGKDWFELPMGTTLVGPLGFTTSSGTVLAALDGGSMEYDGFNLLFTTEDLVTGRGILPSFQQWHLSAPGTAFGATVGNFFGASSAVSLSASSTYDIECYCYFLKSNAGTLIWAPTFSTAPTVAHCFLEYTPVTGFTTTPITGAMVSSELTAQATATLTYAATASLTTAVYHIAKILIKVTTNTACNLRFNVTQSAGTMTPQTGSYYRVRKVISDAGVFVA